MVIFRMSLCDFLLPDFPAELSIHRHTAAASPALTLICEYISQMTGAVGLSSETHPALQPPASVPVNKPHIGCPALLPVSDKFLLFLILRYLFPYEVQLSNGILCIGIARIGGL